MDEQFGHILKGARPLDEKETAARLSERYAPFKSFFDATRRRITRQVELVSAHLPQGRQGGMYSEPDGLAIIILPRSPSTLEEAHVLAHEYGHILLEDEGFPSLGGEEPVASTLSSAVLDPIIERRLAAHGFDYLKHYGEEIRALMADFRVAPRHLARSGQLYLEAVILGLMLDDDLAIELGAGPNPALEKVGTLYPEAHGASEQLHRTALAMGLATPHEVHRFFRRALYTLDLTESVKIVTAGLHA